MKNDALRQARELLNKQECARGLPKCNMVESGHNISDKTGTLTYRCPTCDRCISYSFSETEIDTRTLVTKGEFDLES
jgi:hypothetical protein